MKKVLHSTALLLLAWCLSLAGMQQARASHAQAGQLTYKYVSTAANGDQTYRVRLEFYRDCSGIAAPASFPLRAVNACGGTARTATLVQVGTPVIGNPYCASVATQAPCPVNASAPTTALANYLTATYEVNIVLPPAAEWILSIREGNRPYVGNLVGLDYLYLEARLNSRITPVGGGTPIVITNNSPDFATTNIPVPFVYKDQETTLSFAATDMDGDSLVYSLDRPLDDCGVPVDYAVRPALTPPCRDSIISFNPPCIRSCTGLAAGGTYSATQPFPVNYALQGSCPGIIQAVPAFQFNASQAQFTFSINRYVVGATSASGQNKYAVVGKITEYRRVGGRAVIVGTARRDFLVIVIAGTGNLLPSNPSGTAGPPQSGVVFNNSRDTTSVSVFACNYSRVRLDFTDPNNTAANPQAQNLTVFYPANLNSGLLEGGDIGTFVISGNGTSKPGATFYFQPTTAMIGRTILVPFRIEDDGCPVKGVQFRNVLIKVIAKRDAAKAVATPGSQGLGGTPISTICPGGSVTLNGSVIRPDSIRVVATGVVQPQVYRFQWQAVGSNTAANGLPAVTNTQNLTVNPTVTTRYRLFIEPTLGFGTNTCGDTTSILVRVAPEPVATVAPSLTAVCAGAPVSLVAKTARADGLLDTYTYSWSGPGLSSNVSGDSIVVNPTTLGTNVYTVNISGDPRYGCDVTRTVAVEVVPAPVVELTTSNLYICPGGSATLSTSVTPPTGFTDTYAYRFNSANGLANSDLTKPNPTVSPLVTTSYVVNVLGNATTGCGGTATVTVNVIPASIPKFRVDSLGRDGRPTAKPPVVYTFTNETTTSVALPGAVVSYEWTYQLVRTVQGDATNGEVKTFSTSDKPAPLEIGVAGTYRVVLTTRVSINGVNCQPATVARTLVVPDLTVPNIITPNGDGKNDVFRLSTSVQTSKLEIYNRWGRKIKEFGEYHNDWNGENYPSGMYYYLVTDRNGAQTKGWLEINRGAY